ncbi:uncharacterized protein [Spinacia oleracea]|uniref:Uncharacterized protein isoform X2 n=1 Tax=Spinacia oleracea TaxID=3562 RepID=A0ABM3RB55_SPIOL|nr:uncharacterized protein LOC130467871 isoform X2 [Spinacia oleracea]XP_056692836.1 uncharacterized protein LOC130467871 isoform X2 [Spinacia oleracea]XP_056692840.1 uncharacterized protein LOC130467871 isoform X2 [Spinacia oleracea]
MVFKKGHTGSNKQWVPGTSNRKKYVEPEIDEDDEEYEEDLVGSGDDSEDTPYEEEGEELEDEEEDDDEEYVDEDEDEGENDVGVKCKLKNQGRKTGNAKGRRPVVVEEDDEFYDDLEVDARAKLKMKERCRKYAKSRRLANDVEDEGNDDEEDDEEDGEADVRRVGKKHPKNVGQNVRRYPEDEQHGLRKKHLKVIRKRRRGDTDDEEEQGKPVKKKLLLKKKVGKIVDKERRKGKSPLKDKGMTKRGKNRRVFLRVPIPQHPMSRGEYAKCHDVVVATQRANCDRKTVDVVYREPRPLFGERRPLAEEVADLVMERMAPLLQDLRAVIREQVIIRRLGAKESVAEKDPSPGVAEKDPSPASSSHRQISDNAYINVDGEPMAVDKSVNKVLSELDVIVLEEDETDNVQHTVEQPLGGEENVFVNYQSLPVEQPVFEFLHVPAVVAVQNEPMEEAEQLQQGPPQQVVELVQNEPMVAEQLQKGPPQQAPPQQVVELVQHLEAMQNEPMEALPQHEPQQEPRHEPVQQGHTEGDQGEPQEEGLVVPVVQQEADPQGPVEEPPQNDFAEPQNDVLEDPENEDEEDGEEGDEEDGEEGDEDEEDVGNTADQDKPGDDDDENQGANGGTTGPVAGEAEGADNAEGPGADGTENTRGGGEGLDHGAVHGSNPEDFDGAEPGGDGQVRTRIKAARPKPSPKPRTATKRSRKPSEKAIAMRKPRQRLGIRMTKADSSILKYVEAYDTKKKAGGAMLIEYDGNDANQQMCYSVVHPRSYVNSQYVRTIGYLYNREWASEFPKSCRRLMLDSMFAHQKLKTKETYAGLLKKWSQPLRKVVSSDISVVFVPVVENEHWWCVAFALKDLKIWFIDSMYKNPAAEHSAELKKLIPAVDYVLLETDKEFNASPAWQTKQMGKWPLDVVGFPDYNDNHACGVVMLMAIRETANAFKKSMHVGEIGAARKALFLSHLNSDYNSCRPLIPEIIATHCR